MASFPTNPRGTWQERSPLSVARSHPAVAAYQDRIYAFGGGGPGFRSLNVAEVYDPALDRWSRIRDMPTLRSGAAALVHRDRIYVIGGGFKKPDGKFRFLTTVEIYDPQRDAWERGPDLLQPHDYPAAAALGDYLYIIGGHHPDATEGGPQTDPGFAFAQRLNPDKGGWEAIAPLPTPRFAASAVVLDGRLWCAGGVAFTPDGFREFDCIEVYDPAADRWLAGPVRLPWTCAGHGSCLVGGRFYLFGGFSGEGGIGNRTGVYSLSRGRWNPGPPLPAPRAAMGVAVVDGAVYLLGGWAADRSVMAGMVSCPLDF